jgi:hypothetical protein
VTSSPFQPSAVATRRWARHSTYNNRCLTSLELSSLPRAGQTMTSPGAKPPFRYPPPGWQRGAPKIIQTSGVPGGVSRKGVPSVAQKSLGHRRSRIVR